MKRYRYCGTDVERQRWIDWIATHIEIVGFARFRHLRKTLDHTMGDSLAKSHGLGMCVCSFYGGRLFRAEFRPVVSYKDEPDLVIRAWRVK